MGGLQAMTDERSQQEPSMEDILASIRRILSESEKDVQIPPKGTARDSVSEPKMTFESAFAFEREPVSVLDPAGKGVLKLTDDTPVNEEEESVMKSIPPLLSRLWPEPGREEEKRLASTPTAAISAVALSGLLRIAHGRNLTLGHGDVTLETLVRETLRPLLKAWLDKHLPAMIERVVAREIERLVHQVDGDKC